MVTPKKASTRIVINSAAQYVQSVISIFVSLYSARLILNALGESDFGIYSLVGGVVTLLSFIGSSLVITTQRYLSYHQGVGDAKKLKQLFANSLLIHLAIGMFAYLILQGCSFFLFDGFLNITEDKLGAAKIVYQCVIFMTFLTLCMSPFKALLVSHENIVYTSCIGIIDCFLKLGIAIYITTCTSDKLIIYAVLMSMITIFDMVCYVGYSLKCYEESTLKFWHKVDRALLKSMFGFTGWTIWSHGCTLFKVQGVSIVINKFFGTVLNASYGIGTQVNGAVSFVSSSVIAAFNPQIVKAAGKQDIKHMYMLAAAASKFSTLLLGAVVVPLTIFAPLVLEIWLGDVPKYAVLFCRVILITSLFDLITFGLASSNQALGNIKNYSLYIISLKLLPVPLIALALYFGIDISLAVLAIPLVELVVAILRIPYLHYTANLDSMWFIKRAIVPTFIPFIVLIGFYLLVMNFTTDFIRLVLVVVIGCICYLVACYFCALSEKEKRNLKDLISRKENKNQNSITAK